jgi:hypothetical protein
MRNFSIVILLTCALFTSLVAGEDQPAALWKNLNTKDLSWVMMPSPNATLLNARKNQSTAISELTYTKQLKHAVNVFGTLIPTMRLSKTDGCGLNITDANGVNYFLTMRDDYEAGIVTADSAGRTMYLDFVKPTDPFKVQLGTPYAVDYHVSNNLVMFHIKGGGKEVVLQSHVNVTFPVTLKIIAQRSAVIFTSVRITSEGNEDKNDVNEPKAPKANG